jgi:hypothetical protein
MTSVTRWVLAHKRVVTIFWIAVTLIGIVTVGQATKSFSKSFSVPGREGFVTNAHIARLVHNGGQYPPLVPVVTLPAGRAINDPGVQSGLLRVESILRSALPGVRTASYADTHSRALVSADGRTTFVLAYPRPDNEGFGDNTRRPSARPRC